MRPCDICEAALTGQQKILDPSHSRILSGKELLAALIVGCGKGEGDYSRAEALLREVFAQRKSQLGENHPHTLVSNQNLGTILVSQGKLKEAESILAGTLEARRETLGASHPYTLFAVSVLGRVYRERGKLKKAERYLKAALKGQRAKLGPYHIETITTIKNLAQTRHARGDLESARTLLEEALSRTERNRIRTSADERNRERYASNVANFHGLATDLSLVHLRMGSPDDAFNAAERGHSRALLDLLARSKHDVVEEARVGGNEKQAERLRDALKAEASCAVHLRTVENRIVVVRSRTDIDPTKKARSIETHEAERRMARTALARAERAVFSALRDTRPESQPAPVENIRSVLREGERLISYAWSEHTVILFLLSPVSSGASVSVEGVVLADEPGAEKQLRHLARQARTMITRSGRNAKGGFAEADSIRVLHELSKRVLPPSVYERLQAAKRVIVIPDGPLTAIPFECLVSSKGAAFGSSRFLLDENIEISYAPSGSVFLNRRQSGRSAPKPVDAGAAVVLGDPVFESTEKSEPVTVVKTLDRPWISPARGQVRLHGGTIARLPGSGLEAKRVAATIRACGGEPTLLLRNDATLANLERDVRGKRYVHLATHGILGSRERPYDASLALARPADAPLDDVGFLTLDHVIRHWRGKLDSCDLAVLSACNTCYGREPGDTVLALPWGFMYAGARSVVSSLWKVDDTSTAILMRRFYSNVLAKGMSKAGALSEAKRWLRTLTRKEGYSLLRGAGVQDDDNPFQDETDQSANERAYQDPFYWAGFILIGEP